MRFQGTLYRASVPVWAAEPFSGEGARLNGGRFNPKGVPALYTALTPMAAVRETGRGALPLQPVVLVSYEADIESVFDLTAPGALSAVNVRLDDLAEDWRKRVRNNEKAAGHILAGRLIGQGYTGAKFPSFLPGAGAEDINMVLWTWGPGPPARLTLNDAEGRLGRLAAAARPPDVSAADNPPSARSAPARSAPE